MRQRFGGRAMKAGAACGQVLMRYSIFARPLITRRCFRIPLPSRFALLEAQGWNHAIKIKATEAS
jgi:hypothetical protein